jgi:hypothetical protein
VRVNVVPTSKGANLGVLMSCGRAPQTLGLEACSTKRKAHMAE